MSGYIVQGQQEKRINQLIAKNILLNMACYFSSFKFWSSIFIFSVIMSINLKIAIATSLASNRVKGCNIVQRASLAKTWGGGNSHCLLLGGRLCNRDEYCPNGRGKYIHSFPLLTTHTRI